MTGRALMALLLALACLLAAGPAGAAGGCPLAWGVALDGYPIGPDRIEAVAAETGLAPRLVVFFLQWPAPGQKGLCPVASLKAIAAAGALPVLTWEPMYINAAGKEVAIPAADILAGRFDGYLADFAGWLKAWGGPVVVRLGHEMNLRRYHWGTSAGEYGPASPGLYRRMFRYVVDAVRGRGARNIRWAFCPNAESLPHPKWHQAPWNTAAAYWPGGRYVDVLGMDGYNWGTSRNRAQHGWQSRWQGFGQMFGELRRELAGLAPDKPLVVFETSCSLDGGARGPWLEDALKLCRAWGVRALVWFQARKELDWRLMAERDRAALATLGRAAACPPGSALAGLWSRAQASDKERR